MGDPGTVHGKREPPEHIDRLGHGTVDRGLGTHVAFDIGDSGWQRDRGTEIQQHHPRPQLHEPLGDRKPEARRAPSPPPVPHAASRLLPPRDACPLQIV